MVNHPNRNKNKPHPSRNPTKEEIRAARDALGYTQQEAARVIHASLVAWQQWEQGVRRMHAAMWELFRIKAARIRARAQMQAAPEDEAPEEVKEKPPDAS